MTVRAEIRPIPEPPREVSWTEWIMPAFVLLWLVLMPFVIHSL